MKDNFESKPCKKIIGIGASAGGLKPIKELLSNIPGDTGYAYVIVQHLPSDRKSLMKELLATATNMSIYIAEDQLALQPNCIYLNIGTANLTVKDGKLRLDELGSKHELKLPIDMFFHSLASDYKENSVGVILSGTGSDGSRGIRSIKQCGGLIFAQNTDSADFDGMPDAAIETGLVDFILSPDKIGKALSNEELPNLEWNEGHAKIGDLFSDILRELKIYSGVDFHKYKRATLLRRIEKRISIHQITELDDYVKLLRNNLEELEELFKDILIGVTGFFRDQPAFDALLKNVIPQLFRQTENLPVRIWVPGCSTGEEVYSLAILIDLFIQKQGLDSDFKIFGTDVNNASILNAGKGLYKKEALDEMPADVVGKYFLNVDDKVQIINRIRKKVAFSVHNMLEDPPFIRMDLISCRNALIYFEKDAQEKLLDRFKLALNQDGFLFLGSSESLSSFEKGFDLVDHKWKIFKINQSTYHPKKPTWVDNSQLQAETPDFALDILSKSKYSSELSYYRFITNRYGKSLLFLDDQYNIQFIKGDLGYKLIPKEGLFQPNLSHLVDHNLAMVIKSGIRRLEKENVPVTVMNVLIRVEDGAKHEVETTITFEYAEVMANQKPMYMVEFGEERVPNEKVELYQDVLGSETTQRIEELEDELQIKKEELQGVIEELQSANEELRTSNEELQGSNEELQSMNEELFTVNAELQEKNLELRTVYDMIKNLIDSTDIATLFLDKELNIKKFTPAITRNVDLTDADIDRSIVNFMFNFDLETRDLLIDRSKQCLADKVPFEKEVVDDEDTHFLLKINPYLTRDKEVNGVVISFVDIDDLVSAESRLVHAEKQYETLFDNVNSGFELCELIYNKNGEPHDLRYIRVNREFERIIGVNSSEVEGQLFGVLSPYEEEVKFWVELAVTTLGSKKSQTVTSWSPTFQKHFRVQVFCAGGENRVGFAFQDVTAEVVAENKIKIANESYENLFSNINAGFFHGELMLDDSGKPVDLRCLTANEQHEQITGLKTKDIMGKPIAALLNAPKEQHEYWMEVLYKSAILGESQAFTTWVGFLNGYYEQRIFQPRYGEVAFTIYNVTDEVEAENKVKEANLNYRNLFQNLNGAFVHAKLVVDDQGNPQDLICISANDEHERITGIFNEEFIGGKFSETRPAYRDDLDWLQTFGKTALTGTPQKFEHYAALLNKYFEFNIFSPREMEVAFFFQDVTLQVEIEQEIKRTKENYENLFNHMNEGFAHGKVILDEAGKAVDASLLSVNPWVTEQTGIPEDMLVGEKLSVLLRHLPDKFNELLELFGHTAMSGKIQDLERTSVLTGRHYSGHLFSPRHEEFAFTFSDITESKLAQQKIEASNYRLNLAASLDQTTVWLWDVVDDKLVDYNEYWKSVFDLAPNNVYAQFNEILHSDDIESFSKTVEDHMQGRTETYKHTFRIWDREKKSIKWIHNTGKVIERDEEGNALLWLGVSRDITQERQAYDQLVREKRFKDSLTDNSTPGLYIYDLALGYNSYSNKGYEKILGWNADEIKKMSSEEFFDLFHPDDRERIVNHINVLIQDKVQDSIQYRFRHKNGNYLHCLSVDTPYEFNEDGSLKSFLGSFVDVSEVVHAYDELERQKKFSESVSESSTSGMYIFDVMKGKNIFRNQRCCEILGYTREELEEMDNHAFTSNFHPDDLVLVIDHMNRLVDTKTEQSIRYRFKKKSGDYVTCYSIDTPYELDNDGNLISYIGSFIDVTDLDKAEKEMMLAKEEAVRANRQKDLFLANMSHEIRTPINGILGFSKLLNKKELDEQKKQSYIDQIDENSRQLMTIVDDILQASRLDHEPIELIKEPVDISQLVEQLVGTQNMSLNHKDLIFSIVPGRGLEEKVCIDLDRVRISQVLNNLLSNAVKYSQKGTIEIGYSYHQDKLILYVKDEGVGIKKDKLQVIFNRFSQADEDLASQTGGIGLGLSITKSIVEAMGGEISVESRYGKGATFTVHIPCRLSEEGNKSSVEKSSIEKPSRQAQKTKKVIIADDNDSIQLYYREVLEDMNVDLIFVNDGLKAVEVCKSTPDVDLILMDIRMPNMDGPTAFREIRKFNQRVKIIAQSSFATEDQVNQFKSVGFDNYLTKPIEEQHIFEALKM